MTLPDESEIVARFDAVERRLECVEAFSSLLTETSKSDNPRILAQEAQSALAALREGRQDVELYVGRKARRQVREAEIGCSVLVNRLADRDLALPTAALRRCLRLRPRRDPQTLAKILGFYLQLGDEPQWSPDRVDKVDLLLTQLSQRLGDPRAEPDAERLSRVIATSHPTPHPDLTELERSSFKRNLAAIQSGVEAADSLGELIEGGTLKKYRSLKHRLGQLLLHPDLMAAIIETNLGLQRKIRRLSSRTLTGIFSIYQGIFETGLNGRIEPELREEIDQVHQEFARFESQVKHDDIRLTEMEDFWTTLTGLSERLEHAASLRPEPAAPASASEPTPFAEESPEDWLTEDLMALLDLLRETDQKRWPAEYVTLSPKEGFHLETREIVAWRRLSDEDAVDKALEMFLLKAAALRRSIKRSARKLAEVSDMEVAREMPVFGIASQAVRLAESFLARYSQAVEQAILDGDISEAQQLQTLRMRLVRESAGVWLQIHQPT